MTDFIKNIQSKPKKDRVKIFLFFMSLFSVVVVFFWIASFKTDLQDDSSTENMPTLQESIKASINDVFKK